MNKIITMLILLLVVSACKTKEKLVYFQDKTSNQKVYNDSSGVTSDAVVKTKFTTTFKVDDFLSIQITGEDPDALAVFTPEVSLQNNANGYVQGNPARDGYLIDPEGTINLPIIGKFHIAGLTRMEAIQQLEAKIGLYIKSPVIQLQIQNYKITVLGEVRNPGTFKIPNERITLLEAIGLAGDLKATGVRKNVLIVRDENGVKTEFRVDLTSKDIFQSPAYYLQQNDVIYVEPNLSAQTEATLWRSNGGLFVSLTSIIITTIALITR
ncbi:MAG: polysaccharide biosynthesis/export family protein [Crocinitomicaceae bacterium]|nr:polysaccharide biosynthesis/export family protein [Crocinitomicaceae bacterium]